MYVCLHVYVMSACMHVFKLSLRLHACLFVSVSACVCPCLSVSACGCLCLSVLPRMHMYVGICVCSVCTYGMYVCTYVGSSSSSL